MPLPVQAAMTAALNDDGHVVVQRGRYASARLTADRGVTIGRVSVDHSEAGLYLWVTRDEDSWDGVVVRRARHLGGAG